MIKVSNADRVVFPAVGRTKGEVVAYYERMGARILDHLRQRPLSIRRYPKGLGGPGFFQKNVPAHYPPSFARFAVPRSQDASKKHRDPRAAEQDVTVYPLLSEPEQLAYLANQGAIELHAPLARVDNELRPDRVVIDLDPPANAFALARRAAHLTRAAMADYGLPTVPVATGSKGYHIVAAIEPTVEADTLASTMHKLGTLLAAAHPNDLTVTFKIALRGGRVFVDWLRNTPSAHVIVPYSLRATARATVAVPLAWEELEIVDPDAFGMGEIERLRERPDSLTTLSKTPADTRKFVAAVDRAFDQSGLVLEVFDRFRS
jgi:bifunctional non-homologous end joining protein LigD